MNGDKVAIVAWLSVIVLSVGTIVLIKWVF